MYCCDNCTFTLKGEFTKNEELLKQKERELKALRKKKTPGLIVMIVGLAIILVGVILNITNVLADTSRVIQLAIIGVGMMISVVGFILTKPFDPLYRATYYEIKDLRNKIKKEKIALEKARREEELKKLVESQKSNVQSAGSVGSSVKSSILDSILFGEEIVDAIVPSGLAKAFTKHTTVIKTNANTYELISAPNIVKLFVGKPVMIKKNDAEYGRYESCSKLKALFVHNEKKVIINEQEVLNVKVRSMFALALLTTNTEFSFAKTGKTKTLHLYSPLLSIFVKHNISVK